MTCKRPRNRVGSSQHSKPADQGSTSMASVHRRATRLSTLHHRFPVRQLGPVVHVSRLPRLSSPHAAPEPPSPRPVCKRRIRRFAAAASLAPASPLELCERQNQREKI